MAVTLGDEPLSSAELKAILASASGLALVRGQWVEVDTAKLDRMIAKFQRAEHLAASGALTFIEAMRLTSGATIDSETTEGDDIDLDRAKVVAGPWLAETLRKIRTPSGDASSDLGPELHATLRPYQSSGVH